MNQEIISSVQNPTIKRVKKLLSSGKARSEEQLAVAEGIHLAKSFEQMGQLVELVMCAETALANKEVGKLFDAFEEAGAATVIVKDSLFESVSDIHAKVGILIVFKPVQAAQPKKLQTDAILLEDVQDPGNLGTLLRTASAAGINDIYLSPGSASAWSPKALRAGMGAQFNLHIYENVDLVKLASNAEIQVLATHLSNSQSLYGSDVTSNTAWVFGSEGQGLSDELLAACMVRINIPQVEGSVESLNVAASVAVCLFEQHRQRQALNG